jgi:uncharacterized protein (DUF2164 family)
MPIKLAPDTTKQLHTSIKRFVAEQLDQEIGDLKASLFLEYVLEEIGPSIYNKAVADVQSYFEDRTADLPGTCYEKEFGYWVKRK